MPDSGSSIVRHHCFSPLEVIMSETGDGDDGCSGEFDLAAYLRAERELVLSPFNVWVTGVAVGHSPTEEECWKHFVRSGGNDRFRREHVFEFFRPHKPKNAA